MWSLGEVGRLRVEGPDVELEVLGVGQDLVGLTSLLAIGRNLGLRFLLEHLKPECRELKDQEEKKPFVTKPRQCLLMMLNSFKLSERYDMS